MSEPSKGQLKTCTGCGATRPIDEFNRNRRTKDGRSARCQSCTRAASRDYRRRNPNKQREWVEANRERYNELRRLSHARHKQHKQARQTIARRTKRGTMVRPDACERCGMECKPQGHHPDHDLTTEVMWLCQKCHTAVHMKEAA